MKRYRAALGVALTTTLFLLLFAASALAASKPSVGLKATPSSVTIGQASKLTGTVKHPKSSAKKVTILDQVGTAWKSLTTAKLSSKHAFSVKVALTRAGTWRLKAQYKAGSTKVFSKVVIVTVKTWTAVSAGWAHTMALKSDGTLWAWGDNGYGALGLGSTAASDKNSPTQVDPGSTWKAVSTGCDYTVAIKSDGTLWAWGENNYGQLGLGSADGNAHPTPTQVASGTTWKAVSCGQCDTLAIKSDGTLWGWGSNGDGELGLNSTSQTNAPAQVGSVNTWTAVSSGFGYSLALRSDGSLWSCGDNSRGELGLGNPPDETHTFAQVDAGTTWAGVAVSSSDWYTVAIKSDGTLWGCGHNDSYQLGLGSGHSSDKMNLTQVGSVNTWKTLSCGYNYNLAVKSDGTLWGWGSTTSGNLGQGTMDSTLAVPTQVGSAKTWASVSAGYEQTLAIKADGSLWAWGDNFYGSLGLGNYTDKDVPTEVTGQ